MKVRFTINNLTGRFRKMHSNAEVLYFLFQQVTATLIELHRHKAWCKLDNMRLHTQVLQRLGSLKPQQATANNNAYFGALLGGCSNLFEIIDSAINEGILAIIADNGWHERVRTCGQYQLIVLHRNSSR